MTPINGISLEQYAELGAEVAGYENDQEQCAKIVEARGVRREDWDAAVKGWTARMQDPANMGRIATTFMPMYQAALGRKKGQVNVSFEDYVAMSGAAAALGIDRMLASYGLDMATWAQIAGHWNTQIPQNIVSFGNYGMLVEQEANRLRQGGGLRPVSIQKAPVQVAAAPQPATQAAAAQQMENQMMGAAVNANVNAHIAAAQAQAAAAYGQASQNMGFLGRGMMGAMGMGAIASGIGPGMACLVQWSDGNKYPGTVVQVQGGQVLVGFSNGQQQWIPENAVTKT